MASDDCEDINTYHDGYDHQFPHTHNNNNLSRLSMCSSSMYYADDDEEDEDDDDDVNIFMSRLSIESFDVEFSDEKVKPKVLLDLSSADDDVSDGGCYSLPATPPRRRNHRRGSGSVIDQLFKVNKDYASDNEWQNSNSKKKKVLSRRQRHVRSCSNYSFSGGESETGGGCGGGGGGGGCGVVVITRPKGGKRSLCMDLEEVKACNDLGFELQHERMLEVPGRVSASGSNLDTGSSGGNSPIANWRISSPGDNPRDVKSRIKVWAQAVALATTSPQLTKQNNSFF
ncbi:hypothetical protein ACFE04_017166 [Oxalis oulophora]